MSRRAMDPHGGASTLSVHSLCGNGTLKAGLTAPPSCGGSAGPSFDMHLPCGPHVNIAGCGEVDAAGEPWRIASEVPLRRIDFRAMPPTKRQSSLEMSPGWSEPLPVDR